MPTISSLLHSPRKRPLKVTPEIAAVRRTIQIILYRAMRGEDLGYKQSLRTLRSLLIKLIEESRT